MINAVSPAATQQALTSNTAGSHQQHSELLPAAAQSAAENMQRVTQRGPILHLTLTPLLPL